MSNAKWMSNVLSLWLASWDTTTTANINESERKFLKTGYQELGRSKCGMSAGANGNELGGLAQRGKAA